MTLVGKLKTVYPSISAAEFFLAGFPCDRNLWPCLDAVETDSRRVSNSSLSKFQRSRKTLQTEKPLIAGSSGVAMSANDRRKNDLSTGVDESVRNYFGSAGNTGGRNHPDV